MIDPLFATLPSGFDFDTEMKTKHGIDKLQLMVKFIHVFECEPRNAKSELNKLKSYLVSQLHRGIHPEEDLNLYNGILAYIQSEPATNGRTEAMKYLFELTFLNE